MLLPCVLIITKLSWISWHKDACCMGIIVSLPRRSIQEHSELKIEQRIDEVGEDKLFFPTLSLQFVQTDTL